jgi:dTDP-glucose 4,6-dehydratase
VSGQTYNVGGRSECRNIVLVRLICGILDELLPDSPHCPHENLIEFVNDRPGHDLRYAMNARKLERELGWVPAVSLEEGLRLTVKWYIANSWWWKPICERFAPQRLGLQKERYSTSG